MQFQDKVSTATTSDGHFSFCQETSPQIFFPSTLSFSFCLGRYTFYESVQQFRSSLTSSLCKNSAHQLQFCHVKLFGTNTHTRTHALTAAGYFAKTRKTSAVFLHFSLETRSCSKVLQLCLLLRHASNLSTLLHFGSKYTPNCWSFDKFCENANNPFHQGLFLGGGTAENDVYDHLWPRKTLNFCNGWSV